MPIEPINEEQARAIYRAGEETVVKYLVELSAALVTLHKQCADLQQRVKTLEDQLARDSHNSHKPPSSDGPASPNPKSRRKKGKRKNGGQPGHPGHTLRMSDTPDYVVRHRLENCPFCERSLQREAVVDSEKRQVHDLPPMALEVTEHEADRKQCPRCNRIVTAPFPEAVKAPVQYGANLQALGVYLTAYQLLPLERTAELYRDLFDCSISQGTLVNFQRRGAASVTPVIDTIKQQLIDGEILHCDETSANVQERNHWMHVSATETLSYYAIHPKRGRDAIDAIGILPEFQGTAIHDCWAPYFKLSCRHAICNAHILRELIFVEEQYDQKWAVAMSDLLLKIKGKVEGPGPLPRALSQRSQRYWIRQYDRIVRKGLRKNPLPQTTAKKRGRPKRGKVRALLERLRDRKEQILAFMRDASIPFDNNLGERDLRMNKVKQKISGAFRGPNGPAVYCKVRSYIATARKQGHGVMDALLNAMQGTPLPLVPT